MFNSWLDNAVMGHLINFKFIIFIIISIIHCCENCYFREIIRKHLT